MNSKTALWVGRISTSLVALQFSVSAAGKIFYQSFFPEMAQQMEKIGLPLTLLPTIAALELACLVTYLIPATSVLGAVLFTGYLGGAMLTHLRIGEPVFIHIILGGLVWLGIYLREPRLRALLPFRR